MKYLHYILSIFILLLGSLKGSSQNTIANGLQVKTAAGAAPEQAIPTNGGISYFDGNGILKKTTIVSGTGRVNISVAAMRALTTAISGAIYRTTDIGKEGEWVYDPSDNTSTDNTGTVIVDGGNHRFKRIIPGDQLNVTWFGAIGDSNTDCSAAITRATAAAAGHTLYFPSGKYLLNSMISTPLINTNWLGQDSTSVITGGFGPTLVTFGTITNANIRNMRFVCTYVNATEQGVGMITTSHTDIINFTTDNCWFTNPATNSDAICFLTNIGDSTVPQHVMYNINITHNHFFAIGRIAVDIFNRKYDAAGSQRAQNIHVDNNFADSLGTKGTWGLFVSFDGTGNYNSCNNNHIRNAFKAGIEMNHGNSQVIGNVLEYTTRSFIPLEMDPIVPIYGMVVANNQTIGSNTYSTFFLVNNSQFYGNRLFANMSTAAGDGAVYLIGCNNNTFTGERYSSTVTTLRLSSQPTPGARFAGFTCSNNQFRNCIFTATVGVSSRLLISSDSTLTFNNVITQCSFIKAVDSTYFQQVQGASNNYVYDNYHDGTLANFTVNPLYPTSNNPQFTGNVVVPTLAQGTNDNRAASTAFVLANASVSDDSYILSQTQLGGNIKGQTLGVTLSQVNSAGALQSGMLRLVAVYIRQSQTVTGIKWVPSTAGSYTSSNTNGVALYSWSAGVLTKIAESNNTGGIWSTFFGTGAFGSLAFSSPHAVTSGVYFVGLLYNSSAETTAPTLGTTPAMTNTVASLAGMTGSTCLSGFIAGQTSFPSTINFTSVTPNTTNFWIGLY